MSTPQTVAYWTGRNGTRQTAQQIPVPDTDKDDNSQVEKYVYADGADQTEVVLVKGVDGGHAAPSIRVRSGDALRTMVGNQNAGIVMAEEVWAFFEHKSR